MKSSATPPRCSFRHALRVCSKRDVTNASVARETVKRTVNVVELEGKHGFNTKHGFCGSSSQAPTQTSQAKTPTNLNTYTYKGDYLNSDLIIYPPNHTSIHWANVILVTQILCYNIQITDSLFQITIIQVILGQQTIGRHL